MAFGVRYDKLLVIPISNITCLTPEQFEDLRLITRLLFHPALDMWRSLP
jgi:hypothetical protein